MTEKLSLFDVEPTGRARKRDRETSKHAARAQHATAAERDVLWSLYIDGPQCGTELARRFGWRDDGTTRTAVSRLVNKGLCVYSGKKVPEGKRVAQAVVHLTDAGLRELGSWRRTVTVEVAGEQL